MIEYTTKELKEGELIGVHCTHGLNRTGYMVIYYLCSKLNVPFDDAIVAFEESRKPHEFEKEKYIEGLVNELKVK